MADARVHTVRLDDADLERASCRGAWLPAVETSFSGIVCSTADFKDSRSLVVSVGHEPDTDFGGVAILSPGVGDRFVGVFGVLGGGRGDVGGV